jgi:DegV family protein with EDD domain
MSIQVLTDSTSYIDEDTRNELNIKVASLNVRFDDNGFREMDIDNKMFYEMMEEKGIPVSSQPSVGELYDKMEEVISNGDSLICVFLSSDMSGTYSTAHMAKQMILEKYSDAKIEIIDSRSNSMQLGFAAIAAARAAKQGKGFEQAVKAAEENILRSRFLFIPDNLVYLQKGGRIGRASALIGNLLKIIPILTVENGITTVFKKVRTKKNAVIAMMDKMLEDINDYGLGEVVVHNINCYDEAADVVENIRAILNVPVKICDIGPVIGLHVGPGAIGIAYYTEKNMR